MTLRRIQRTLVERNNSNAFLAKNNRSALWRRTKRYRTPVYGRLVYGFVLYLLVPWSRA